MKCQNSLDIAKVVLVTVVPPLIIATGAAAGVYTVSELLNATTRKELIEKLILACIVWLLTPIAKMAFASFIMKMDICDEKARRVALWLYAVGFAVSLALFFTLYPPYVATFEEGWRELTEFVYLGPTVSTYLIAISRLINEY